MLFNDYFKDKNLTILIEKTFFVIFTRKNITLENHYLTFNDVKLKAVSSVKYLGLNLDYKLYWNTHFNILLRKARKRLDMIKFLRGTWWGAHPKTLLIIYKSYIRSLFEYGSSCFVLTNTYIEKFEIFQRKAIRLIFGYRNSTPNGIVYAESKIQTIHMRLNFLSQKYVVKLFSIYDNPVLEILEDLNGSSIFSKNKYNLRNNLIILNSYIFLIKKNIKIKIYDTDNQKYDFDL